MLLDANYKLLYVDVGCNERISNRGVFKNCSLYHELETGSLNIPQSTTPPGYMLKLPHALVADDAFPLKDV